MGLVIDVVSPSIRMVYVTIYTLLIASAESIVSIPSESYIVKLTSGVRSKYSS